MRMFGSHYNPHASHSNLTKCCFIIFEKIRIISFNGRVFLQFRNTPSELTHPKEGTANKVWVIFQLDEMTGRKQYSEVKYNIKNNTIILYQEGYNIFLQTR